MLPPLAMATVPPPGVAVTTPPPLLNEGESAMGGPAGVLADVPPPTGKLGMGGLAVSPWGGPGGGAPVPPPTVKLEMVGLALSTWSVPVAVTLAPLPGFSVAVSWASAFVNLVVSTSKAKSGAGATVADAGNVTVPAVRVTDWTPVLARAVTWTRTVPLTKSAGECPSTPTTAMEAELVEVPAEHFPGALALAPVQTGKSWGQEESSAQGTLLPSAVQAASASESAATILRGCCFAVSIIPSPVRPDLRRASRWKSRRRSEGEQGCRDARQGEPAGKANEAERLVPALRLQQLLGLGAAVDAAGQVAVGRIGLGERQRSTAERDHRHSRGDVRHRPLHARGGRRAARRRGGP